MNTLQIALLADIGENISSTSISSRAVFTYELVNAIRESAVVRGSIALTLFARKNSSCETPLVSLDPSELGLPPGELSHFAAQEAFYQELFLRGMLNGYDLIHCVAPLVSPLLQLAHYKVPVVQTILEDENHPSVILPKKISGNLIRQVGIGKFADQKNVPPAVDLSRFYPDKKTERNFILRLDCSGDPEGKISNMVSEVLKLPVRDLDPADPVRDLQQARIALQLPMYPLSCDAAWLLRALACGTPVAGYHFPGWESLMQREELGFLFGKDLTDDAIINGIMNIPDDEMAIVTRHEFVMAHFSYRATAARYREIYKSFFSEV